MKFLNYFFNKKHATKNTDYNIYNFSHYLEGHASSTGNISNIYKHNVIVYRCINLISQTASHVPWLVYKSKNGIREICASHMLHKLLLTPNPRYSGADFFAEVISNMLLFGNSYILAHDNKRGYCRELHILHPKQIEVMTSDKAITGYKYSVNGKDIIYPVTDLTTLTSNILHLKTYNPYDPIYGLSPIEAAQNSIDAHNLSSKWNNALLKNGARPSGALVMKDSNSYLSEEQFYRIKEQLNDKYTGASNAGKPLLLEGGLDWREMSISPKDMDFVESKNSAAREIALAFGVPPQLLGINGDNTYSNMQEARLSLWEETIIPLLDKISDALTYWLSHILHEDIIISFDKDAISAIVSKREALWSKVNESNFMTINEKRMFVGLKALPGCDILGTKNKGDNDD